MPEGAGNIAWPSGTRNVQKKTPRKHKYDTILDEFKRKIKTEKYARIKVPRRARAAQLERPILIAGGAGLTTYRRPGYFC